MSIHQKDLKLLWGRAANRCSICRVELSYDATTSHVQYPLGEQAHIVAENDSGPRGKSILSDEERNSYFNLVLLCPTHHAQVDTAVDDFPVERLHLIKDQHEQWVREQLTPGAEDDPALVLYAHIVDVISSRARLAEWDLWVGWAASPEHRWPADTSNRYFELYRTVQKAAWPGKAPEFERAALTLATTLVAAANLFLEHSEHSDDDGALLRADRFYKDAGSAALYDLLSGVFEAWSCCCVELLHEATRAANWFADAVRKHLNPQFFLLDGRFSVVEQESLAFRSNIYEYSVEDRADLPATLEARILTIRAPYEEAQARLNRAAVP